MGSNCQQSERTLKDAVQRLENFVPQEAEGALDPRHHWHPALQR
jgi:hypothetical protein